MTPEQIQRAKSIVEYAAVESLETEEIVLLGWAIQAIAARDAEIADLKRGGVVVPEIPTWEDGENKLRRGENLTALEKFVIDHDWHKTDTTFRDGLEAVFAELRANQGGADHD